jgi:hypothetical protein
MRTIRWALLSLLLLFFSTSLANAIAEIFEWLCDGIAVTNRFSGLLFLNATFASTLVPLYESEFPRHLGSNVVFNNGGPITITFLMPRYRRSKSNMRRRWLVRGLGVNSGSLKLFLRNL